MAKKGNADAYGKLVRIMIVLFVLAVICGAGYMLLDQSIKTQQTENAARAEQENAALQEEYRRAKVFCLTSFKEGYPSNLQWSPELSLHQHPHLYRHPAGADFQRHAAGEPLARRAG